MTGPEHYRRAEGLAAEAHRLLGQGDGRGHRGMPGPPLPRPMRLLARAAATAVGASGADNRAWAEDSPG